MTTPTTEKAPATITEMYAEITALSNKMLADNTTPDQLLAFQKEQATLITAIRTTKESRVKEVGAVKAKLKTLEISIQEAYGDDAIKEFADDVLLAETKSRGLFKKRRAAGTNTAKTTPTFKSDANPLFIVLPKAEGARGKSADVVIRQGRANEFENGNKMFTTLKKPMSNVVGKDLAETEKNLSAHIVKGFTETAQSKAELKKIAKFFFDFGNKAPHNEAQADMQAKA